ncbi:RteC domain-containing protein [Chitinophaga barathri]|uniref:Tetracycline regulation of excision, RteC n=1 Tax=Chitinophaga barathri TaxID=1647451 RepID=A0A3N4MHK2_9BACT|nr:RteC domain-containing protein [Chitinophaga barathri]RPD43078.1 hypothetical protein EG028_01945 [Chitinophaga barathri]
MTIIKCTQEIIARLLTDLEQADHGHAADAATVGNCVQICAEAVQQINAAVETQEFTDTDEQIHFFRKLRPQIDGRLFYYLQLLRLLAATPVTGLADKQKTYREEVDKITNFRNDNKEFLLYCELNFDFLDLYYFTRSTTVFHFSGQVTIADKRYYAPKSHEMAADTGYRLLEQYLDKLMYGADMHKWSQAPGREHGGLQWTGTIAALTELAYAVNELGMLGGRKLEINKLAEFFERIFGIRFINIYKAYEGIRIRKRQRTPFLDALRTALVARFEYDDAHCK